jgi:hypothetical protein
LATGRWSDLATWRKGEGKKLWCALISLIFLFTFNLAGLRAFGFNQKYVPFPIICCIKVLLSADCLLLTAFCKLTKQIDNS